MNINMNGYTFDKEESFLERMINENYYGKGGRIRFRFYGDFDEINIVHESCKNELFYLGSSFTDGSPVFAYDFENFNKNEISDVNKIKINLRSYKLKKYMNEELSSLENSMITFFDFLIRNYEKNLVNYVRDYDINFYEPEK